MDPHFAGNRKPYAVVIGLDSVNGLQAARVLSQRNVPVIGVAKNPRSYFCRTNVCEKIDFVDTESEGLIEYLERLGPSLDQKAVLVPCNDLNVLPISRHRSRLDKWYCLTLPEHDVIEMLMNKTRFYRFAQREGFPIPRTFFLEERKDAEQAAQKLTFPCVMKPSIRSPQWEQNLRYKAYKIFTKDEFLSAYDYCVKWCNKLIVQEWVEGSESNLYTCYCCFNANAEPLVAFVTHKLRQWPPQTGEGCLGEECRNDIVLREAVRLFRRVAFRGLGYLEMKRDSRTGKHLIIEPNVGRPTSRSATAEAGGVELLYTMYCDALGWGLPVNREQKYGSSKWIFLRRDMQSAFYYWRRGELTLWEWWKSIRGKKIYALFSWTDPGPFLGDLYRVIGILFKLKGKRTTKPTF